MAGDVVASTERDSGQTTGKGEKAERIPGYSGSAQASSQIDCPEAGCTGR